MLHSNEFSQIVILIVKSASHFILIAALASVVAACGQKGPLYLPGKPAQPVPVPPPPQTVPVMPSTSQ
ncbi:LPS translocon maturation chaperone LptM [Noviherbaspirillum malthae]|uniref:LPS translocon maturation chaperone LptM n=1 Tax=Noviherbaspirillum malthae TaxID=1260987 RepID=UPI00188FE865|nr:lipoprotein [Noviherbaspirillum malthae]